jgi:hypothetical protein
MRFTNILLTERNLTQKNAQSYIIPLAYSSKTVVLGSTEIIKDRKDLDFNR